jgi:archaellum component FlaC
MSGWGLTGRLISKHFSVLGEKVAEAIASFDPETATEADRDRLQATLQQAATKLAAARASFDKERAEVEQLRTLIANDEKVAEQLAARLADGSLSEDSVTMFCDELEANKARLPQEIQEEADAKQYASELQQIVDAMSQQLAQFDAAAKKAKQQLAAAQAQQELQRMRLDRQAELDSLKGLGKQSSALNALTKRAQSVSNQAAGMKIVADIQQKPIDQAREIDAIRTSVANGNKTESLAERLARLSGKTAEQAAA